MSVFFKEIITVVCTETKSQDMTSKKICQTDWEIITEMKSLGIIPAFYSFFYTLFSAGIQQKKPVIIIPSL